MQTPLGGYKISISGKNELLFLVEGREGEEASSQRKIYACFQADKGGRELFLHVDCQLPLA